jgi:2-keto-4-pentenoate hydratase/2-oxohepta-3-ene-1,7-dioic acid hydratase in catechol pathway
MRIVGIRQGDGSVAVGDLSADGTQVTALASLADFWADPAKHLTTGPSGAAIPVASVELVPPVLGTARVICIGLNYPEHVKEGTFKDAVLPEFPTLFARWPASLTVDGAGIPVPLDEDGIDWEGEVVAWVGSPLVDAAPEEALAAVIGYSTFNDVTARWAQKRTSQWIIGKNGDNSGPLGPMVPTSELGDLRDGLRIETRVNGEVVQQGNTSEMSYGVGETLALISRNFTINPGDLLATGTPSGVGYAREPRWLLGPGDTVEVEIERLGTLTNHVVGNEQRHAAVRPTPDAGTASA